MSDVLKSLVGGVGTFVFTWILPGVLGVGAFGLLVFPSLSHLPIAPEINNLEETQRLLVMGFAALILGIILRALSTPLYRVLEGYYWPKFLGLDRLQRWRVGRHVQKKHQLQARVDTLAGWQQALVAETLQRYPVDDTQVVPTRLGNALRAFETYGSDRYSHHSQTLWTELESVVPESLQKELDQARASVDFLVGLLWLSVLFAAASLGSGLLIAVGPEPLELRLVVSGAVALALVPVWYRMAVVSTSYWASSVQALVNLGRKELAGAMGLRMPETLAEERTMWELLGTFVYYPYDASWSARLDQFRGSQPPNKAIVQAFVDEVINKGNFERACELATSDLDNQAARAGQSPGLAGLLDEIRGVRTGFPDIAVAIVSAVEAGDRVAVRWVARGTHRGPFRGWA